MLKFLFNLITDPLGLPIPILVEYIILAGIGAIAFSIGWDASPGGPLGALIHWSVRLIVFVALWAITYGVIAVVQWVINHWIITTVIISFIVLLLITVVLLYNRRKKAKIINRSLKEES